MSPSAEGSASSHLQRADTDAAASAAAPNGMCADDLLDALIEVPGLGLRELVGDQEEVRRIF